MNYLDPSVGLVILANALVILVVVLGNRNLAVWRGGIALACSVAVITYLLWRYYYISAYSTDMTDLEGVLTKVVFIFEILNFLDFFLFMFTMSRISNRTKEADEAQAVLLALPVTSYPSVDVFIATYNEDWEILEKTIFAVQSLDYPKAKVSGYILDDGKRDWLKQKCLEAGFGYLRRAGNAHKKPGNHNYALSQTSGEFVAMFDADFIPMPAFLTRTVGLLLTNKDWGIVQTPQTFYNYDPMRNNLKLHNVLPDDTAMFFTVMEPCRDAWGCAFYVGSSALMRRTAIESISGIVMGYDTEDQITSIAMLQAGLRTGFLNESLSVGLAPESLPALFEQRKRWARGSIQILFSIHGPFGPNLTMLQRLMFCQSFWLIGFIAPIVYALIPAVMWLFQIRLFPYMPPEEVFWLPLFLFSTISLTIWWLSNGLWYPLVSPALQLLLSIKVLPTIMTSLIKPFGEPLHAFIHVTPKGKRAQRGPRVEWAGLLWLLGVLLATGLGIFVYIADDYKFINHPDELKSAFLWTAINMLIVFLAMLCCLSPNYKRTTERLKVALPVKINDKTYLTRDISLGGCKLTCADALENPVSLYFQDIGTIAGSITRTTEESVSIKFEPLSKELETALFVRLFLHQDNHSKPLAGPLALYGQCFQRITGKIE